MSSKSKRAALAAETVDPAEVAGAVGDGILIARSAATIAVANRIIVRALREQKPFDRHEASLAVRDELGRLSREQRELAVRMVETRDRALRSKGRSRHQFDYRPDDNSALAARETIYTTIADRIDESLADEPMIDDIVTAARDRAWSDIGGAVISHMKEAVVPDVGYEEGREDRLKTLLDVDLASLMASPAAKASRKSSAKRE